jgi:L-ascorbate metabolism protein UlaG (beta-lactamase superfamily)
LSLPGERAKTSTARKKGRRLRKFSKILGGIIVLAAVVGLVLFWATDWGKSLGGKVDGARLARIEESPNFAGGRARNKLPTDLSMDGDAWKSALEWFRGAKARRPPEAVPVMKPDREALSTIKVSGVRFMWLGHSTVYLEIDGTRVLIDPVWSERASPFRTVGPKRSHEVPIDLEKMPTVDVVVISHDHYDHLDMDVVASLAPRGVIFAVPLGVGAHLESWGVSPWKIIELDWWEGSTVGSLALIATPARHFSGRWVSDSDRTLWASWTLMGPESRVFYSGDTGWHDEFESIGERYGPFDLTIMKCGAYDDAWPDIHINGIQAVEANLLVKGRRMLPVHWLTFDLALHPWAEPVNQVVETAADLGVDVVTPRPGEIVDLGSWSQSTRWWEEIR